MQFQPRNAGHGSHLEAVNRCYSDAHRISEPTVKQAQLAVRALRDIGAGRRALHTSFSVKETPLAAQLKAW
jgi:hypothetical protein